MKFKENIYTEEYIKYCTFRKKISLLAQFQHGILPLHIETDRFRNKKVEERVCLICKTNVIEDEQHFVCVCKEYLQLRENMYAKVNNLEFNIMLNEGKLVYLTNHHWKELSIYIEKASEKKN